tara:strand:+ start:480 stop:695 length:216 start_codon:yes stop_codon:yes gene_type:complete
MLEPGNSGMIMHNIDEAYYILYGSIATTMLIQYLFYNSFAWLIIKGIELLHLVLLSKILDFYAWHWAAMFF